jgi:hypothetical protein
MVVLGIFNGLTIGASGLGVAIGLAVVVTGLLLPFFFVVVLGVGFWLCNTSLRSCLGRICPCATTISKQSTPNNAIYLKIPKLLLFKAEKQ